jgi:hypothetical protein
LCLEPIGRINGKHSISNQSFPMSKMLRYVRKLDFSIQIQEGALRVFHTGILARLKRHICVSHERHGQRTSLKISTKKRRDGF